MRIVTIVLASFLAVFCIVACAAPAPSDRDLPPGLQIPDAARPGPGFDVERATQAYVDLLSPGQRNQSDAYFEGGYWLQLWGTLYALAVATLLLWSGLSRRMRETARRISTRPWLYTWLFGVLFVIAMAVLNLPLSVYADFVREKHYGLSTQDFGGWFGDALKSLLVALLVAPLLLVAIYAAVRRAGARWWIWAGGLTFAFALFAMMLAPVYVAPLFNDYKPLRAGAVREAVLSLARANGIPTDGVVEFDASRQTTRISANVSGFAGTTRVALNDNLLEKTSTPEIKAVLGHEMGHYVLNHGFRIALYLTLVLTFGFWLTHRLGDRALARWGARLGLEGRGDPAALPLAIAILTLFDFVATPLTNTIVRQAEAEADAFGLNAAREPNGFAMAAMRLSTYRKIHPGLLEEIVFYDHPSGWTRVHGAMTWLKENPADPTGNSPPGTPLAVGSTSAR
jgi:STE24 endopeptidase